MGPQGKGFRFRLSKGVGCEGCSFQTSKCSAFLGFEVPYFNTFFKGTIMKYKFILFSPLLLKRPVSS